ncbi:MAG: PCI domain-containing protein [Candidatus Helarchaeota archaeon]|nr:PCI domain-containing protein [Candidatus Helarchaeota archaeon]
MTSVRDTFERNVEGLNDFFLQHKNEIETALQELIKTESYEEALEFIEQKIGNVILEFEKRKKNVSEILETKLKLTFDVQNKGIITEWENAITSVISQIEQLGTKLRENLDKKTTEVIRIPAIEKFFIDSANRKAFARLTFDFIAKRLKVPVNKVQEVAENLIFDGKLNATMDVVSGTVIFPDVVEKLEAAMPVSTEAPPSIPPAPRPAPVSKLYPAKKGLQPIGTEVPLPDSPQPLDLSLEPLDMAEGMLEIPPDELEIPPEINFTETIDLSTATGTPQSVSEAPPTAKPETLISEPIISEEEKEARGIISFFKSSVDDLSEEDKAEAKRKREEKRKKLEEVKRKKKEKEKKKGREEKVEIKKPPTTVTPFSPFRSAGDISAPTSSTSDTTTSGFRPAGDITGPSESKAEELIKKPPSPEEPISTEIPPEKRVTCAVCEKDVSKEDPTVIPCPHACGAFAHKKEFLDKGYCPACNEEIKDVDVEFSSML